MKSKFPISSSRIPSKPISISKLSAEKLRFSIVYPLSPVRSSALSNYSILNRSNESHAIILSIVKSRIRHLIRKESDIPAHEGTDVLPLTLNLISYS